MEYGVLRYGMHVGSWTPDECVAAAMASSLSLQGVPVMTRMIWEEMEKLWRLARIARRCMHGCALADGVEHRSLPGRLHGPFQPRSPSSHVLSYSLADMRITKHQRQTHAPLPFLSVALPLLPPLFLGRWSWL